jgi:putative ABC transport system substrate-binding protein
VFGATQDPVRSGLVASLNRPGGNVTGVSTMGYEIVPKQLGIMKDLLPEAKRFGLLIDTNTTAAEQLIASLIGRQIEVASAHDIREIDASFATFLQKKVNAAIISQTSSPLRRGRRCQQYFTIAKPSSSAG